MKRIKIFIGLALIFGLTSCSDLDKLPEGVLSTSTAFSSTAEITKYLNQFYETGVRTQSQNVGNASGIAFGDMASDNMISNVIDDRLAGETALSDATKLTN